MKVMVFDVGGTEIKYSVMDEAMRRMHTGSVPTPQDTQEHFLDALYQLYLPHKDEVEGIAMAVPGFVNTRTGYLTNGGALLYNTDTPLGLQLGHGGGIIANGQLVRGVHFTAGEYSFVNTNAAGWDDERNNMACQCSTTALLEWYRARKGLPADAPIDGRRFFEAANAREPEALDVLERFCHAVAVQIYNLTVLLDVEKVAIGGGISKQPLLLETLRRVYDGLFASRRDSPYMKGLPRCQIVPCAFSSEANQVGALYAYLQAFHS